MAYSSIKEFSKHEQHTSLICQALAHPARLRIVSRVGRAEGKMLNFQTLSTDLPLSAPTIKQHINYLRKRKVLILGKSGSDHVYKLNMNMPFLINCVNSIINEHDSMSEADIDQEFTQMSSALL